MNAKTEGTRTVVFESRLGASMDTIWDAAGTMEGVNAELGPWVRMTVPASFGSRRIDEAPTGSVLFASWILVAGLPVDRHFLKMDSVSPPHGFCEHSTSWLQASWIHERTLVSTSEATCTLRDRVVFRPRIGLAAPLVERIVGAVFAHRHRQLVRRYGEA